jgi:hypothetical protein
MRPRAFGVHQRATLEPNEAVEIIGQEGDVIDPRKHPRSPKHAAPVEAIIISHCVARGNQLLSVETVQERQLGAGEEYTAQRSRRASA